MKWRLLTGLMSLGLLLSSPSQANNWKELNKLCDPPGTPSVRAAKVATQGMSRQEMTQRLAALRLAEKKGRSAMGGEQRSILRREIKLLELGLENK
jgi:hypothetical protein